MLSKQMKTFLSVQKGYINQTYIDDESEDYLSVGEAIDYIHHDIKLNIGEFTSGVDRFMLRTIMKYMELDTQTYTDDMVMELIVDLIERWEKFDDKNCNTKQ